MSAKLDYVMDELLAARQEWDTERFRRIALEDTVPLSNPSEDNVAHAARILTIERQILNAPNVFFVEPDMHRLILAAMETFQPEDLLSTDLITPSGYVRLPEPIEVPAVKDSPEGFASWDPDAENPEGYVAKHSAFGWKRLALGRTDGSPQDEVLGDGLLLTYFHARKDVLGDSGFGGLYPGRYLGWPLRDTVDEERIHVAWHPAYLYPRVFFRLVMQRLTQVEVQPSIPRAVRRRHERAGYELPRYSVVRLRRPKRPNTAKEDEQERKWKLNYRTVTRGHWRNQWYPSIKAHRQIWIDDFVRGPEDAELIIRDRVFDVRD